MSLNVTKGHLKISKLSFSTLTSYGQLLSLFCLNIGKLLLLSKYYFSKKIDLSRKSIYFVINFTTEKMFFPNLQ